jgi:PadR family transcriptional regulator, regulatory protein PadR
MNKFDDNECCDMRGLLGFLILFLLSKKSMHGQDIANEIAKKVKKQVLEQFILPLEV